MFEERRNMCWVAMLLEWEIRRYEATLTNGIISPIAAHSPTGTAAQDQSSFPSPRMGWFPPLSNAGLNRIKQASEQYSGRMLYSLSPNFRNESGD